MNQKRNKGITLIALVITIIVLLILAGVTINMMLGDDGIIAQAEGATEANKEAIVEEKIAIYAAETEIEKNGGKKARSASEVFDELIEENVLKEDDEDLKEKALIGLIDIEAGKDFGQSGTPYKLRYGMLTGITPGTMVSEVEKSLPNGYEILDKNGNAIDDEDTDANEEETTLVGTGMQVVKNGKMVLRLVIYGDIDGNGEINVLDLTAFQNLGNDTKSMAYYKKEAADVKNNKILDGNDISMIESLIAGFSYEDVVGKNRVPNNPDEIVIKTHEMAMEEYIKNANKALQTAGNTTFRFEPLGTTYELKGITSETTLKTLLTVLPDNTVICRVVDNEYKYITKNSDETTLAGKVLLNDILTISDYYDDGPKLSFMIAFVLSIESV